MGKQIRLCAAKTKQHKQGKAGGDLVNGLKRELISETMSSLRERLFPHHPNNGKGLITDTFQFYLSLSLKKINLSSFSDVAF